METSLARETEDSLWTALNTLEEAAKLYGRLAAQETTVGDRQRARRFAQSARTYRMRADTIRKMFGDGSVTGLADTVESKR